MGKMDDYQSRIEKAKEAIEGAEYILLGGGAGVSAAAGITYSGKRFTDHFGPFIRKFDLTDMYSSGFYPFPTQEDRWGYWAKRIRLNRFETGPTKLYQDIYRLVKDKQYFVLTTTLDSQFELAGFSPDKVFETHGNYRYLQCAAGCHDRLYNNEILIRDMVENTVDCKIPHELVPKCPVCGDEMAPNIRINKCFVQDEKFYELEALYKNFVLESIGKERLFIGLGVKDEPLVLLKKGDADHFEKKEGTIISFNEDIQEIVPALSK
ncbi:hypothetical protein BBD42_25185 [Paenibacillus sp. BIHB 4019]|uniref:protein acetyllysine N-acetyltransferase n=1 Tax=Paenibacillus sp. BIHB 4019 TaxID=1870819 RepID=A0A1B2DNX4_9BACL|nr:Sir2 family NAD-dependent protein deacetylase [Paenibacillus sp. BIHB 4019]ANY69408.1 hypothetical protein BBD42_25185 [Paenibacillus sp. BIHB 4019]